MAKDRLSDLLSKVPDTPVSGLPDLVRRAYDLGREVERDRTADAHLTIAEALRGLGVVIEREVAQAAHETEAPLGHGYGDITNAVSDVIKSIGSRNFTGLDIVSGLRDVDPNTSITYSQVRSALKSLTRQNKLVRPARGQYRATSSLLGNGIAQDAPTSANHAIN